MHAIALDPSPVVAYHPYHVARADALVRLGRRAEAVPAYDAALFLAPHPAERAYLRAKRDAVAAAVDSGAARSSSL